MFDSKPPLGTVFIYLCGTLPPIPLRQSFHPTHPTPPNKPTTYTSTPNGTWTSRCALHAPTHSCDSPGTHPPPSMLYDEHTSHVRAAAKSSWATVGAMARATSHRRAFISRLHARGRHNEGEKGEGERGKGQSQCLQGSRNEHEVAGERMEEEAGKVAQHMGDA